MIIDILIRLHTFWGFDNFWTAFKKNIRYIKAKL